MLKTFMDNLRPIDDYCSEVSPIQGKAKRPGTVHSEKNGGEERRQSEDLITVYKHLKRGSQVNGARFISLVCSSRTKGETATLEVPL